MLSLLFSNPLLFIVVLLAIIVALSFHESAHAFVAYKLGDMTAQRMGRLTLNPLSHIDWYGLLLLVVVGFGWGKPVPFNPHNLRLPKWGPVMVAFAGPFSNLLLAVVFSLVFSVIATTRALEPNNALMIFLGFSVIINLALMFFNLIPIPPLDGSKLLLTALDKPQHAELRYRLETQGMWILIAVLVIDAVLNLGVFSTLFSFVQWLALNVFLGGATFL
ncbi:hypothetical protein A3C17_03440 [Candidatus Uhrbacteria bacterium RIFCSPHIGHO2_02_FULL_53_13]|uniref:Peptidase M50 domain-containing protein n=2 Tax=Candidatus Uhriibacteriota TaxID=1752732 RepID=A0A1F7TXE2_9BACT|nr:MAG: hypothetical protein A3C17_03440 [Candidatus Uhrbacteria bacterium RIFCSPHIGHO2_02_FULL_53_13]OGL89127.1 MAG: hypothetical protein A3I45_03800 [Candidatus Uhrbacteria bacterium RIFCSPLOWO2_02_FULL_53_10]